MKEQGATPGCTIPDCAAHGEAARWNDLLEAAQNLLAAQGAFNRTEAWSEEADALRAAIAKATGEKVTP